MIGGMVRIPYSGTSELYWLINMAIAIGIDGCKGGWFFFRFDEGIWRFGVEETITDILSEVPGGAHVLIDIPIGLKERGKTERECDLAARELLKPKRQSSVFPAPCRQVLKMDSYDSASKKNQKVTGRRLSRQSWGLVPKIREVDDLMRRYRQAKDVVREAHPELLFCGLAGGPMAHNKKTREGFTERMTIVQLFEPDAKSLIATAFLTHGGYEAARDDIVDAFVLTICAQQPDRLKTVPEKPPVDPKGLPMQMVYLTL
jgi:predicted RNase H-like nuclease